MRARRICILYFKSSIRFYKTIHKLLRPKFIEKRKSQTYSFTQINLGKFDITVSQKDDNNKKKKKNSEKNGQLEHTPLLNAVSISRSLSVSSNKTLAYRNRTRASTRGCNLQFCSTCSQQITCPEEGHR